MIDLQNFPVQHFSATAIRTYLTDRQAFKKRFIMLEFDDFKPSPALIEGKIFHSIIEKYWCDFSNDFTESKYTIEGLCNLFEKPYTPEVEEKYKVTPGSWNYKFYSEQIINRFIYEGEFEKINFGKTGSQEKSIQIINNLVEFYFGGLDQLFELEKTKVLSIEVKMVDNIEDLDNNPLPIALKGFCDLIYQNEKGEIIIVDHKTVTSFSTHEDFILDMGISNEECLELGMYHPVYELQAATYWFLVRKLFNKNPSKMEFHQIKKSKNRDGSSQFYKYTVDFNAKMIKRFIEIYSRIVKELSGQPLIDEETGIMQFLPNPFQQFGWTDSWLDFCREVDSCSITFQDIEDLKNSKILNDDVEAVDL